MRILGKALTAVLLCGATLTTQGVVLAQGAMKARAGRPSMAGQSVPMKDPFNLTEAQKTKLKAMVQAMRPQFMAIQSNTSLSSSQKQMKVMALQKSFQVEMETILTPAQKVKFKQMQAQRAAMMKQQQSMMHSGASGGKPDKGH